MSNSFALRALVATALLAAATSPVSAQGKSTVSVHSTDSTSFIVSRRAPRDDEEMLRTRDRTVALVLRDTAIVLQLTDLGMKQLFAADTAPKSGAGAIFARMAKAGMEGVFDHGIAYRLSALRAARADGTSLVLEDHSGKHVFENTELNGTHPMQDFDPTEVERFARLVQRKIAVRR